MKVNIIGIPLYSDKLNHFIKTIIEIIETENEKSNCCISATGAHGLVYSKKNEEFREILKSFYANLPDGMPGVWVGRLKGAQRMERCYGPDFFMEMIKESACKNINHFFCGGKPSIAEELKDACERKFNNKNVVGTYSPPFKEMTEEELKSLADEINRRKTNILWIGLSTPKQEKFAYRISKYTNVNFIATVGAAFDFHTGKVKQAPKILQKMSLEWLFRLFMEPRRLYKRYFEIVPLFIKYNLEELIIYYVNKRSNINAD